MVNGNAFPNINAMNGRTLSVFDKDSHSLLACLPVLSPISHKHLLHSPNYFNKIVLNSEIDSVLMAVNDLPKSRTSIYTLSTGKMLKCFFIACEKYIYQIAELLQQPVKAPNLGPQKDSSQYQPSNNVFQSKPPITHQRYSPYVILPNYYQQSKTAFSKMPNPARNEQPAQQNTMFLNNKLKWSNAFVNSPSNKHVSKTEGVANRKSSQSFPASQLTLKIVSPRLSDAKKSEFLMATPDEQFHQYLRKETIQKNITSLKTCKLCGSNNDRKPQP